VRRAGGRRDGKRLLEFVLAEPSSIRFALRHEYPSDRAGLRRSGFGRALGRMGIRIAAKGDLIVSDPDPIGLAD
jgi:hypothetical protein